MNRETPAAWREALASPATAGLVLAAFWILLLAGVREKGLAYDETVHATAGASYWMFNDYRLDPENGNLPQRLAGLPLVLSGYRFPPIASDAWRRSDEWVLADQWFHRMGHNEIVMLWRGRIACGLLALALGALVWAAARRLFGGAGGLVALLLYVLNPAILAHGALMTSDLAAALFFLAAPLSLWALLRRLSPARLLVSGLALGGLAIAKMSAVVILPVAGVLVAARLAEGGPLPFDFGRRSALVGRGRQALALAAVLAVQAAIVAGVIWASYGFRYAAFAPGVSDPAGSDRHYLPWAEVLDQATPTAAPTAAAARILSLARRHHLLPEAYLYGAAYAWRFSGERGAFLNGAYSLRGWRGFFPYAFLVKTPLALFGVLALAAAAAAARWRRDPGSWMRAAGRGLRATLPLWALLGCFGIALVFSHVDIGARYLLPIYPPLFILGGGAAAWLGTEQGEEAGRRPRSVGLVLALLVAGLAAETAWHFPNYVAYFNALVPPGEGYRHLVDSSSDWGQELPALRRYLDRHPLVGPRYLAYFGSDSPAYYRIPAELTNCVLPVLDPAALPFYVETYPRDRIGPGVREFLARHPEFDAIGAVTTVPGDTARAVFLRKAAVLQLHAGTYFISSTILQSVRFGSIRPWAPPWGPWNRRYEEIYQRLGPRVRVFIDGDPAARAAAIAHANPAELWSRLLEVLEYDEFRFARLKAALRHREPDDLINGAILVYQLTDADLAAALDGPPPESGPDVAAALDPASARLP
jgi:4-amino-4-deoxy-L-arabinose transferase-like glycosyltransferase